MLKIDTNADHGFRSHFSESVMCNSGRKLFGEGVTRILNHLGKYLHECTYI